MPGHGDIFGCIALSTNPGTGPPAAVATFGGVIITSHATFMPMAYSVAANPAVPPAAASSSTSVPALGIRHQDQEDQAEKQEELDIHGLNYLDIHKSEEIEIVRSGSQKCFRGGGGEEKEVHDDAEEKN